MEVLKELITRSWFDGHLHLRWNEDGMLGKVLPYSVFVDEYATILPNTKPEVETAQILRSYRADILAGTKKIGARHFHPLMTFYMTPQTTPDNIRSLRRAGAVAGKVYPRGKTTNSEKGIQDYAASLFYDDLKIMEELDVPCLLHCEHPFVPGRYIHFEDTEKAFIPILIKLSRTFPKLRFVFEHVSTRQGVDAVKMLPNVRGSITLHHMMLTGNDAIFGKIYPHHCCMPFPNRPIHRQAVLAAALSGDKNFFRGSDSAPHQRSKKEAAEGAMGIFTAPVEPYMLTALFEQHGRLSKLQDFTSGNGAEWYGLPLWKREVHFEKGLEADVWEVPFEHEGIVLFGAGTKQQWHMAP